MSKREIIDKVIIIAISTVLATGALTLFSNIMKAASQEDVAKSEERAKAYTDSEIKVHEKTENLRFEQIESNNSKMYNRVEYLYLRALEKGDRAAYLKELERIKRDSK